MLYFIYKILFKSYNNLKSSNRLLLNVDKNTFLSSIIIFALAFVPRCLVPNTDTIITSKPTIYILFYIKLSKYVVLGTAKVYWSSN